MRIKNICLQSVGAALKGFPSRRLKDEKASILPSTLFLCCQKLPAFPWQLQEELQTLPQLSFVPLFIFLSPSQSSLLTAVRAEKFNETHFLSNSCLSGFKVSAVCICVLWAGPDVCLPVQMFQWGNNHRTCSYQHVQQLDGFIASGLDALISLSAAAAAEVRHEDASVLRQEQTVPGRVPPHYTLCWFYRFDLGLQV